MAAYLSRLLGLPGNPPEAAAASRDKRLLRQKLKAAGLPTPSFITVPAATDAMSLLERLSFPVVVKPTVLSASRGVIRADDAVSFATAFDRVRRLLASGDVRELRDPEADVVQIEEYVDGPEYALEGLLESGRLRTLAVFDKRSAERPVFRGDDLRHPLAPVTKRAPPSKPLWPGCHRAGAVSRPDPRRVPHFRAACSYRSRGAPIGGLCAKALRFESTDGQRTTGFSVKTTISFEELLLRNALGEPASRWTRESRASAVMMIPIPRSGVYRGVDGLATACDVLHVEEIRITAKPDQQLLALPEGSLPGIYFCAGGCASVRRAFSSRSSRAVAVRSTRFSK
jgi:hypothetical protein